MWPHSLLFHMSSNQLTAQVGSAPQIGKLHDRPLYYANTLMKSLLIIIAIGWAMLLTGCAGAFLVGAGVSAGAFSYITGKLTRQYETDYQRSITASLNVIKQHNFKRKEEFADDQKTIIEGYIYFDTPVTIEVVYVEDERTQIGVRTGYVGVDNLEISEQVHADILEELTKLEPATTKARSEPLTIKATSKKKKYEITDERARASENEREVSPPISETSSASMEFDTDGTQEIEEPQEEKDPGPTEEEQDETSEDTAKDSENVSKASPPISKPGSVSVEHDTVGTGEIEEPQEEKDPGPTEDQRDNTADDTAKDSEKEHKLSPPLSETGSVSVEHDTDDTQEIEEPQEEQDPSPTESKNKTFIYYPESALTIHSGSYGALDDVISDLHENPSAKVDIRGYTASSGNITKNLALSRKRVSEIRNYLILHDISEERISALELGATNLLESDKTEQDRSQNHRVDITIR